ncbi:MAG: NnrU family protein [Rhodobacteraceae bacterium]|nr:NnrU family protein [Paracoccaceae bacterium]
MTLLYLGLAIWWITHFLKRVAPGLRTALDTKMGAGPAKGIISVLILGSIVLMVLGYRAAPIEVIYDTPSWAGHLNNLAMIIAIALLGMGSSKGCARTWLRHPMLTGVVVWAGAHLLVNGDLASVLLFGGMAVWAIISILLISTQEGKWDRPQAGPAKGDIKWLVISAVVFSVISGLHIWIGPSPFGA